MNARRFIFAYTLLLCAVVGIEASGARLADDAKADDAKFVKQSVPKEMVVGREYEVSITMKNTGTATWTLENYRLSSQNPRDNLKWARPEPAANPSRISFDVKEVPPQETVTFKTKVKAPSAPGTYNFQWQMAHEMGDWFGEMTPNVAVKVTAPKH